MKALTLYPKLTINGISKNRQAYIPYILTCVGMVMMFYIVSFLSKSDFVANMPGGDTMKMLLTFGCVILVLFSAIFLFYTNSFLIKSRKKELGLYNILGMSKKNIAAVMLWESVIVYAISAVAGIICGILFSKAAELLVTNLLKESVNYAFSINPSSITQTLFWFAIIFVLILINSLRQVHKASPVELLRSENTGDKQAPKLNIFKTVTGVILLVIAYAIALFVTNPLSAAGMFLFAVGLVIIATEFLFTAGSVALCKLLQKNKKYYYKTNHFVSVSQMVFRMNRNGSGLSNICILSTMVLVTLTATISLYAGEEDTLNSTFPHQISVQTTSENDGDFENVRAEIERIIAEKGVTAVNSISYNYFSSGAIIDGSNALSDYLKGLSSGSSDIRIMTVVPVEYYNLYTGKNIVLADNEAVIVCERADYAHGTICFDGENELSITAKVEDFPIVSAADMQVYPSMAVFVKDMDTVKEIAGESGILGNYYGIDLAEDDDAQIKLADALSAIESEASINVRSKAFEGQEFYATFGGFFFLGIVLGSIFLCAAVLIMYYKQISEGFEDKERFEILRKVGMTKKEIKQSINSQVLTVFFAPLVTAAIHTMFALPIILRLLSLFGFTNAPLFLAVAGICIAIFAVIYITAYIITARSYYRIVSE